MRIEQEKYIYMLPDLKSYGSHSQILIPIQYKSSIFLDFSSPPRSRTTSKFEALLSLSLSVQDRYNIEYEPVCKRVRNNVRGICQVLRKN